MNGRLARVVNIKLFEEAGIALPDDVQGRVQALEDQGKTAIVVGLEQEPVGVIAVADVLRPDAKNTIDGLKALGIPKTIMLTGDKHSVTTYISSQVGLTDTIADLMPEDKLLANRELVQQHGQAAMIV